MMLYNANKIPKHLTKIQDQPVVIEVALCSAQLHAAKKPSVDSSRNVKYQVHKNSELGLASKKSVLQTFLSPGS